MLATYGKIFQIGTFILYCISAVLLVLFFTFQHHVERKAKLERKIEEEQFIPHDDLPLNEEDLLDLGMLEVITPGTLDNEETETLKTNNHENFSSFEVIKSVGNVRLGQKKRCPFLPSNLFYSGAKNWFFHFDAVDLLMRVEVGGVHRVTECRARQNAAIIIPYRGPKNVLDTLLYFLHPFLIKQQLDYQVFVVENVGTPRRFHLGQLYNAGAAEALKRYPWRCLIFNEAHLLPLSPMNMYRCYGVPTQLVNDRSFIGSNRTPSILDGVISITPAAFIEVNGFSNQDLGNEKHYTEFKRRLLKSNYSLQRVDESVGAFRIVRPKLSIQEAAEKFVNYFSSASKQPISLETNAWRDNKTMGADNDSSMKITDGLLSNTYEVNSVRLSRFYTHIKIICANL